MRDPKRIDRIVDKLTTLWHANPDLRFGQLVANVLHYSDDSQFYLEDDKFETAVDLATATWADNHRKPLDKSST